MRTTSSALIVLSVTCLTTNAWAFDPNAGAEDSSTSPAPYHMLSESIVPHRYYKADPISRPANAAVPIVTSRSTVDLAPLPVAAPTAAAATPVHLVPAEQPTVLASPSTTYRAPVAVTRAAPVNYYTQPATATTYMAPMAANAPMTAYTPTPTYNYAEQYNHQPVPYQKNRFSLGVDGFWDRYREPVVDLETNSAFGGLDGSWSHYFEPTWFSRIELRGDYGKEDYKSISGKENGITAWEYEARALAGYDANTGGGNHVKPYVGLDMRYYREDGKGGFTNLGFEGYDRRILQFMLPIGVTYDIPTRSGYHLTPTIEGGPLLYGNVSSRLQNVPGNDNEVNHQHGGYELRGDFMVNNLNDQGRGLEFGPFVRYYHMSDSDITGTGADRGLEPENSRLQVGAKMDYLF